jgi:hypothetical protein
LRNATPIKHRQHLFLALTSDRPKVQHLVLCFGRRGWWKTIRSRPSRITRITMAGASALWRRQSVVILSMIRICVDGQLSQVADIARHHRHPILTKRAVILRVIDAVPARRHRYRTTSP